MGAGGAPAAAWAALRGLLGRSSWPLSDWRMSGAVELDRLVAREVALAGLPGLVGEDRELGEGARGRSWAMISCAVAALAGSLRLS